jgi:hypothetical protein
MAKFCSFCGSAVEPTEPKCKSCGGSNDAYAPAAAGVGGLSSGGPWRFEGTVSGYGDRVVGTLGLNRAGAPSGLLEMMIRGAFLDGSVYRQAAADPNGNANALIALIIPALAGMVGTLLVTSRFVFMGRGAVVLLVSALIGVAALIVSIGVMAAASQAVVRRKLDFGHLFRGLAYAQSPGVLAIIPVVGGLLSLWRIVTSLVAVREISGSDVARSAGLLVVGLISSIVVGLVLSPLLIGALAL